MMNYTVHWICYIAIVVIAQNVRAEATSNRSQVSSGGGAHERNKRFIYPLNSGIGVSATT